MDQDESFGIIPLSNQSGQWEVFLIRHKRARYWGFPKGHAEEGETPQEAALRELKEETNLEVVRYLQKEPLKEKYRFAIGQRKISKQVLYFVAIATGTVKLQAKEIESGMWVPFPAAIDQVTHPEGKSILRQVEKILQKIDS